MLRRFLQNTRKPEGFLGRMMLRGMNGGHAPLSNWGLSLVRPAPDARALDVGCGGGANIARLLELCPRGFVDGIDYSPESVAFSRKKNINLLGRRCAIRQGDAGELPYADETFDLITAFETVYFWPDLVGAFREILRALKPSGQFLIVCETDDPNDTTWTKLIDGMRIHSGDDLASGLRVAGFASPLLSRHPRGWIGLLACKRDRARDS